MRHRLAVLVMSLAIVAGFTVAMPPGAVAAEAAGVRLVSTAAGGPTVGSRCRNAGRHVYQLLDVKNNLNVAYAKSIVLSPGETRSAVRNVRKDMHLSAYLRVSSGAEIGAKGLSKLLAKAEARFDAELVGFAKYYGSETTTVRRRLHNATGSNKEFIAYKATREYGGKYKDYFCAQHPVMTHPEWTLRSRGTWRTHKSLEVGTIRCGAGTPTAITEVVARRHCG